MPPEADNILIKLPEDRKGRTDGLALGCELARRQMRREGGGYESTQHFVDFHSLRPGLELPRK